MIDFKKVCITFCFWSSYICAMKLMQPVITDMSKPQQKRMGQHVKHAMQKPHGLVAFASLNILQPVCKSFSGAALRTLDAKRQTLNWFCFYSCCA